MLWRAGASFTPLLLALCAGCTAPPTGQGGVVAKRSARSPAVQGTFVELSGLGELREQDAQWSYCA